MSRTIDATRAHCADNHRARARRVLRYAAAAFAVVFGVTTLGTPSASAEPVALGMAASFGVLAGTGITNTGLTTIIGDIGSSPTLGAAPAGVTVIGTNHFDDATTVAAKVDLDTAFADAAGRSSTVLPTELGDTTVLPGVYRSDAGTFGLTGLLTLDAQDDPDAMFVFQADTTLTTAAASGIVFTGGANPCQVVWKVGTATFGDGTVFVGDVLAETAITAGLGATFTGRLLAIGGTVTLHENTVTNNTCTPAETTTTSSSSTSTSSSTTTSSSTSTSSPTSTSAPTTTTTSGSTTTTPSSTTTSAPTTTTTSGSTTTSGPTTTTLAPTTTMTAPTTTTAAAAATTAPTTATTGATMTSTTITAAAPSTSSSTTAATEPAVSTTTTLAIGPVFGPDGLPVSAAAASFAPSTPLAPTTAVGIASDANSSAGPVTEPLPRTGADVGPLAATALALVGCGLLSVLAARRRNTAAATGRRQHLAD